MTRKILVAVAMIALIATGCSKSPKGPQKFTVEIDNKSSKTEKFQFAGFFPGDVKVSPGDTVKFRNRSSEAPHTVTFGVDAKRTNQPALLGPKGENPAAFKPCYSKAPPTAKTSSCSTTTLPKTFDGTGYWNSGILQPKTAPKSDGLKNVTIKLAKTIPAGTYTFVCVLHPFMSGALTVVKDPGARSRPADVRKAARDASTKAKTAADALVAPKLKTTSPTAVTATAGWGDKITSVNRFAPSTISVKSGTTVTWKDDSPYEPHTVTFGNQKIDPFAPSGVKAGGDYSGGDSNSGIFGGGGPFPQSFSLRFSNSGSYAFACLLHPGMVGTVKVS